MSERDRGHPDSDIVTISLVTGVTGFIGRWTIAELRGRGHDVHALVRTIPEGASAGVTWHRCDMLEPTAVRRLLSAVRPQNLLHLAWYAKPEDWWTSSENIQWVEATLHLLRAFASAGGRRAVISGSCAEYAYMDGICSEEGTPIRPNTLYGACKAAAELVARAAMPSLGISLAWGRVFGVYGPAENEKRLVAAVITALLRGERARCTRGTQIRDYLYSVDVAGALVHLVESPFEGAVNVGSGTPIAVREMVSRIGELLGREDLVDLGAIPANVDEAPSVVADIQRLRTVVGWTPSYSLEEGLLETIEWWRRRI